MDEPRSDRMADDLRKRFGPGHLALVGGALAKTPGPGLLYFGSSAGFRRPQAAADTRGMSRDLCIGCCYPARSDH
jgi:hypothetical protein